MYTQVDAIYINPLLKDSKIKAKNTVPLYGNDISASTY